MLETYILRTTAKPLVVGKAVGEKIAIGTGRVIGGVSDLAAFCPGEVLIAAETRPDWEPVMKTAGAIVTDHGGRTCHAASWRVNSACRRWSRPGCNEPAQDRRERHGLLRRGRGGHGLCRRAAVRRGAGRCA